MNFDYKMAFALCLIAEVAPEIFELSIKGYRDFELEIAHKNYALFLKAGGKTGSKNVVREFFYIKGED